MFYVEHAENSPASVLTNCLKHRYLMGYYGMTFVVCCSRLCFGSIPGLEFSLSIPCVVILMFHGMLKLMLPSYVWLNQRCQRPCPNAALQAWLPVLPKDTPAIDKMLFVFFFFFFLCDFSTLDLLSNHIFNEFSLTLSLKPYMASRMVKNGCK